MRAMPLAARPLLNFPIAPFEMLDDGVGDLVVVGVEPALVAFNAKADAACNSG